MQPRQLVATQLEADDVGELDDGVYLGFMVADKVDANRLSFDLAVWFSWAEADMAARDDGEMEIPVPDGFHIRNRSDAVWSRPVSASVLVTSAWYDQETAPDTSGVEMPYVEFVEVMQGGGADHLGVLVADPWWITIEGGRDRPPRRAVRALTTGWSPSSSSRRAELVSVPSSSSKTRAAQAVGSASDRVKQVTRCHLVGFVKPSAT